MGPVADFQRRFDWAIKLYQLVDDLPTHTLGSGWIPGQRLPSLARHSAITKCLLAGLSCGATQSGI